MNFLSLVSFLFNLVPLLVAKNDQRWTPQNMTVLLLRLKSFSISLYLQKRKKVWIYYYYHIPSKQGPTLVFKCLHGLPPHQKQLLLHVSQTVNISIDVPKPNQYRGWWNSKIHITHQILEHNKKRETKDKNQTQAYIGWWRDQTKEWERVCGRLRICMDLLLLLLLLYYNSNWFLFY